MLKSRAFSDLVAAKLLLSISCNMKVVVEGRQSPSEKNLLSPGKPQEIQLSNEIKIFNLSSTLLQVQVDSLSNFLYEMMLHNWLALKNYCMILPATGRQKAMKVLSKFSLWTLQLIRCLLQKSVRRYFEKGFDIHRPVVGTNKQLVHDAEKKTSEVIMEVAEYLDYKPAHINVLLPLRFAIFFNPYDITVRDYTSIATGEAVVFQENDSVLKAHGTIAAKSLEMGKLYQWKKNNTVEQNLQPFKAQEKPGFHCHFCGVSQNVIGMIPLTDIPEEMKDQPYFGRYYIDFAKRLNMACFNL